MKHFFIRFFTQTHNRLTTSQLNRTKTFRRHASPHATARQNQHMAASGRQHACKLLGRTPLLPPDKAHKMLRMAEPQRLRHMLYRAGRSRHHLFDHRYHLKLNKFLRSLTRLLPHQVAEIVGREAYPVGEIFDGGYSVRGCQARVQAVAEQLFKPRQRVVAHVFTSDEPPFVKAHAVIEQHLYIRDYQRLEKPADRTPAILYI